MVLIKVNDVVTDPDSLCALSAGSIIEVCYDGGDNTSNYLSVYDVETDTETMHDLHGFVEYYMFYIGKSSIAVFSASSNFKFPNSVKTVSNQKWTPHFSEDGWLDEGEGFDLIRAIEIHSAIGNIESSNDITMLSRVYIRHVRAKYVNFMPAFSLDPEHISSVDFRRVDRVVAELGIPDDEVPIDMFDPELEDFTTEFVHYWNRKAVARRAIERRLALTRTNMKLGKFTVRKSGPGADSRIFRREECIVCMSAETDIIFYECRHCIACQTCVARLTRGECPVCRTKTNSVFLLDK